jgi:Protein of unknown function (DUF1348)
LSFRFTGPCAGMQISSEHIQKIGGLAISEVSYGNPFRPCALLNTKIDVWFAYEYRNDSGNWVRSYGNENWEFDSEELMHTRHASTN